MKTPARIFTASITIGLALLTLPSAVCALGRDYPNDEPVGGTSGWPKGLSELVNTTNRVHGFFVNAEDVFFFAGNADDFGRFLQKYAEIGGVVAHKLVVHLEKGLAKSPWDKGAGIPCDWKLDGYPESWKSKDATKKGYVLELHLYVGGNPQLEKVPVPKTVTVFREIDVETTKSQKPAPPEPAKLLKPITYHLQTAQYADTFGKTPEYVYVLSEVAFRSVQELKKTIANFPKGSTLRWAPSCRGPVGLSQEQEKELREFCGSHGIKFVHVPAG